MAGYSQCLPGTGSTTNPTPTTTTTAPTGGSSLCGGAARTKFTYFGVNESGAEFGENVIPVRSFSAE